MEIVLDRREASSTLAAGLRARGIRPVFRHLVTGDVRIGPRLLLERKTAKDLHASVRDGRLLHQVRRLAAAAPRAGLLLETDAGWRAERIHTLCTARWRGWRSTSACP